MNKKELAAFCVRILSAENGIWQGVVEAEGEPVPFESELQLIKWLCRKYPKLVMGTQHKHF